MATEERIRIGRVGAVNPSKREVRITPEPAYKHQFNQLEWLRVAPRGAAEMRCKVAASRSSGDDWFVTLSSGVPRERVGAMKGADIVAAPDELAEPDPDDLDVKTLIGFEVVDESDTVLGAVVDGFSAGGNDVLEVETPAGDRFMMPAVPEAVTGIDLDAQRIIVGDLTPFRVDHAD